MLNKIGSFLLLSGAILLALYALSIAANAPDHNLLIMGGLILLFGFFFWWISPRQPPPPSDRFNSLKKLGRKSGSNPKK
jgi:predicted membrane channel-forming protein YqfA (hemolysin III family)